MCGRVIRISPVALLRELLELGVIPPELPTRYNLAPTDPIPVVREWGTLETMRWGLSLKSPKASGINVRVESLGWPMYRASREKRRCLVVVDGFYEWRRGDGRNVPYFVMRADRRPVVMAGIHDGTGAAVLTRPSQGAIADVHDRMPVILPRSAWKPWVDTTVTDALPLLEAASGDGLVAYRVSRAVNNVRNDDPRLLDEVFLDDDPEPAAKPPPKQLGLF